MQNHCRIKIVVFCFELVSLAVASAVTANASEPVYLSLSFDKNQVPTFPTFIYVGGKIAGAMPGTVEIPTLASDTSVEIGSPQLEEPLYSFVLGEKQILSQTANVVMSNFTFTGPKKEDFWSNLNAEPNSSSEISIHKTDISDYEISLPANPYVAFESVSSAWGMKPYDKDWFGKIPLENYAPVSIPHVTYDKKDASIIYLKPDGLANWTGSYDEATRTGFGLNLPTEHWSIKSVPLGAIILTDQGQKGVTNTEIEINRTGSSFMLLKLDGYVDCPKEKCKQAQNNGIFELECRLKKLK